METTNLVDHMSKLTLQERDPADELTERILKLAIEEDNETDRSRGNIAESHLTNFPDAFAGIAPRAALLFDKIAGNQYSRLTLIDEQLDARSKEVLSRLDSLASPDCTANQRVIHFLEEEVQWLESIKIDLANFVAVDKSVVVLRNALMDRVEAIGEAVDCYKLILTNRLADGSSSEPVIYDAGNSRTRAT